MPGTRVSTSLFVNIFRALLEPLIGAELILFREIIMKISKTTRASSPTTRQGRLARRLNLVLVFDVFAIYILTGWYRAQKKRVWRNVEMLRCN